MYILKYDTGDCCCYVQKFNEYSWRYFCMHFPLIKCQHPFLLFIVICTFFQEMGLCVITWGRGERRRVLIWVLTIQCVWPSTCIQIEFQKKFQIFQYRSNFWYITQHGTYNVGVWWELTRVNGQLYGQLLKYQAFEVNSLKINKKISKWMREWGGGGDVIEQWSIQEWTLNLSWSVKKVKTKNWHSCFEINSVSRTSVHVIFPDLSHAYNIELLRVDNIEMIWGETKITLSQWEVQVIKGSSYRE